MTLKCSDCNIIGKNPQLSRASKEIVVAVSKQYKDLTFCAFVDPGK